ncbi:Smr/MutS family protein [uncultured Muribaculum sp.]|uniref:endonuclease MutS2 n=1 Tax=uncultured Muribaculum sp. TaxID=1918613 RepID=UPI0025D2EF85|nr:Smr/MutS family protein [uncultured Muribaculum sp.]
MTYPDTFENKIGFTTLREWVDERCTSPLGRRHVSDMEFRTDYDTVLSQLSSTAEMLDILQGDEDFPLGEVHDVSGVMNHARVPGTFITAPDLLDVRASLAVMSELSDFFMHHRHEDGSSDYPYLDETGIKLASFPATVKAIDRIIDRFGNVRDNASPELREIRSQLASTSGAIASMMRRVMARAVESGYIESDVTPSMRDGRLVIPVSPMHKRRISGIVHDESASGKTVYIEPAEIVEANNRVRELQMEERREIARILTVLTDEIRPEIPQIIESLDIVGQLDFIRAKALLSRDIDAHMPSLSRQPEMEWYHASHPVLLMSLRRQGKEIVPLDITLTPQQRILIISGPNAGGKSVCLKTVGIVQYMMQCGLLPPVYENSHMGIFSDIFIDIGDDQSLEDDLSTYSSHLRNMKYFLQHGGAATLVLIDEFGGGTEPQIGGAIAQAVLRQFNDRHMWGVITTHYQNLKHFAEDTEGLVNGSMLYDRHLMQPMFKLSIGNPGSSFAVEIARKIGLPEAIIADAEAIVGSDYINLDKYLLDIARDKRYWENKRLSIRQKEKKIESRLAQYEEDAEQLREKRREILAEAKEEARKILDGSNAAIERTIHEIRRTQAEKASTLEARRRLQEEKESILNAGAQENNILRKAPKRRKDANRPKAPSDNEPVKVDDNVRLDGQGTVGKVLAINGRKATVAFGMLQTEVPVDRLKRTIARPDSGARSGASLVGAVSDSQRQRQLEFKQEIDVRGMRVDEAVQAVTYYIDDAIRFNAERVRILHGTGTGALRQYIRHYLDTIPGISSYHDEHVQFGGAGITVVEFR